MMVVNQWREDCKFVVLLNNPDDLPKHTWMNLTPLYKYSISRQSRFPQKDMYSKQNIIKIENNIYPIIWYCILFP